MCEMQSVPSSKNDSSLVLAVCQQILGAALTANRGAHMLGKAGLLYVSAQAREAELGVLVADGQG